MTLYIYNNFSNYYNRRVKRYATIAEYGSPSFTQANINFNPNDGVSTSLILGSTAQYHGTGDYAVAVENGEIVSRWFIMEQSRDRAGQFSVILRRDLIADFYEEFMASTTYLERGWITDTSNYLLFNNENYNANQIKTNETQLIGKDKCMWLIGYVDKPGKVVSEAGETIPDTFWKGNEMTTNISGNIDYDMEVPNWNSWEFWPKFSSGGTKKTAKATQNIDTTYYMYFSKGDDFYSYRQDKNGFQKTAESNVGFAGLTTSTLHTDYDRTYKNLWAEDYVEQYDAIDADIYSTLKADMSYKQYQQLLEMDGKIIYCVAPGEKQPTYIKVSAKASNAYLGGSGIVKITASSSPAGYNKLKSISATNGATVNDTSAYYNCSTLYTAIDISYQTLATLGIENYKWQTDGTGHAHTVNEAYDIFAIPISTNPALDIQTIDEDGNVAHVAGNREAGFIVAQSLIQQAGGGGYDLQLSPYGPIDDGRISVSGNTVSFDCSSLSMKFDYSIVYTQQNVARSVIFWLTRNSIRHTLNYSIANETTPEAIKKANQLDIYRLSSGDYSAQFEFSPVRNRGVSSFIADITYKPFAPYLRVSPFFNEDGLYGKEWGDTRGLVCTNTNFSVSRANNAWETYERNNLNYQNAFNRQIDTMDELHGIERSENIVNAIVGTVSSGAMVGSMASGTGKLGAGLTVGATVASLAGGITDLVLNEQKYTLSRDNAIATHNENLANIKAMPNTLSATGANTINNKVFPLLVLYTCTDAEREAFTDTLHYYGMTINRLTTNIADYLNPQRDETYIRGQLIRITANEDNHLAYEIAQELSRGIYLSNSNTIENYEED
jgi:hypothetical protein